MKALLYVPVVLSFILLAAHFLRDGNTIAVIVSLGLIGLLFVRQVWSARVIQGALVIGAYEWVLTLYELAQVRAVTGESATRMLIILGSVVALTLGSALVFQTQTLKETFGLNPEGSSNA